MAVQHAVCQCAECIRNRLADVAPELLAALHKAYAALDWAECEWASEDGATRMHDCRVAIGRVIDKAEGRTHEE